MVFQPQIASGEVILCTPPAAGCTAGVPFWLGDLFVVPVLTKTAAEVTAGDTVNAKTGGVHLFDKISAVAFAEGAPCFWDETNAQISDNAEDGRLVGFCWDTGGAAAANSKIKVLVLPAIASGNLAGKAGYAFLTLDATAGLAIGSYYGDALPDNAAVTRSWYEVLTTFTSATDAATIALGVETVDVAGIVAAVDIADVGNPWDAGRFEAIQDGTVAAFSVKTSAAGQRLQADVAVEALTAGKLVLVCEWAVTA